MNGAGISFQLNIMPRNIVVTVMHILYFTRQYHYHRDLNTDNNSSIIINL